jgi:Tol biopolymer transport system component
MSDHDELERRVRSLLRETLDTELGPDPTWADSPAARRVAEAERQARRRRPLRVLGIAALVGLAGGAAMFGGLSDAPLDPEPSDSPSVELPSSDGWIAFTTADVDPTASDSSGRDPDFDIWFVALDRDARRVLGTATDSVHQLCPAFSPDGLQLAYARSDRAAGTVELVIADVSPDGAVSDRLAIPVRDGGPPPCAVWSTDGSHLAFAVPLTSPTNPRRSAEGSEVWVVRLEDQQTTVVPDLLATDLEWSPDGTTLAIASGEDGPASGDALQDGRIHLFERSSGEMRTLDATLGAHSLTWSPDGRSIAYTAFYSEPQEQDLVLIRVIDVETEEQRALTAPFGIMHGIGPVWSPDGQTIAYQRGCRAENPCGEASDIVLLDPDATLDPAGGDEVFISRFRTAIDGAERTLDPYRVTWSPDGRYLLSMAWGVWAASRDYAEFLVALPTDPEGVAVLLYEPGRTGPAALAPYEGYNETTYVPIQTWAVPSD